MKKVVAYIRVSTDGQVEAFGLPAQQKMIQDYCDAHEMEIQRWYVENGVSGVKESRPEFDKLLYGEIENPPISAVVVAKNDRVARDIKIYYYFKMLLKKRDIDLISVSEDFGEMGVIASFLEAFTLCVAEMERENITRRTTAGREMKKSAGGYAGGRPPYGYDVVNGNLVVNDKMAACVRLVFKLRGEGKSLKEIYGILNSMGYRTQKGLEFRETHVQNILKNERLYRGQLNYKGTYEGTHARIL